MALLNPESVNLKWCLRDSNNVPVLGMFEVLEGTSDAFPVIFFSDASLTVYLWPSVTTGILRYGTTAPTTAATRATAGGAV